MQILFKLFLVALGVFCLVSTVHTETCGVAATVTALTNQWTCWAAGGIFTATTAPAGTCAMATDATAGSETDCTDEGFDEQDCTTAGTAICIPKSGTGCAANAGTPLYLISASAPAPTGLSETITSTVAKGRAQCVTAAQCQEGFGWIVSGTGATDGVCSAPTTANGCFLLGYDWNGSNQCVDHSTTGSGDNVISKASCFKVGLDYTSTGPACIAATTGSGDDTISQQSCFKVALDYNGSDKCVEQGSGNTDDNKFSDDNCWKIGLTYSSSGCSDTAGNYPSESDCLKVGLLGGTPTGGTSAICTVGSTITQTHCFDLFLVYSSGKCYEYNEVSSLSTTVITPIKQDCFVSGLDFDSTKGICKEFSSSTSCPVAKGSTFYTYSSTAKTCRPVTGNAKACWQYGLAVSSATCIATTSCPHGWTSVNDNVHTAYCKPTANEDTLPCLNLNMLLENEECVIPENGKCSSLNSNLSSNTDYSACEFSSSSLDADIKKAVCYSIGQVVGTNGCTYNSGTFDSTFQKLSSSYAYILFPKEEISCQNLVMGYQDSTSKLCTYVIDDPDACLSAGLAKQMKDGETSWCIQGSDVFDRCVLPSVTIYADDNTDGTSFAYTNNCPSTASYYDYTVTDNYKCVEECDSADWTVNKNCFSSCPDGFHTNGETTATECTQCSEGCLICTYDSTNNAEDCSSCTTHFVKVDDSNNDGSCKECIGGCSKCAATSYETKCTTCYTSNYVKESGENSDTCHQCIEFCKTCTTEDYETYCSTCFDDYDEEKEDENDTTSKIIKCTCPTKYENTQWRNKIFARNNYNTSKEYIENSITTESQFATFYCKIYAYFSSSIPTSCNQEKDTLLDSSEDGKILLKMINRLNDLYEVANSGFTTSANKAAEYLEHFIGLDLATNVVDQDIISAAFTVMNNDLFVESASTIVGLMNDYLSHVGTDVQFTAYSGSIEALIEKMNKQLLSDGKSSASALNEATVKYQAESVDTLPITATLGIQFEAETSNFYALDATTQNLVISKLQTAKRTYDSTENTTDAKVKSSTQIGYYFALKTTEGPVEFSTTNITKIEIATTEGCIDVNFEMDEVLALSDSTSNAVYVGQWQTESSTWAISSVSQANTQTNVQSLNACVSSFKTPFIAMEYTKQTSSTDFSSILSFSLFFLILFFF